jgi:3-oxoacyl-(acyl-carrier-protein) synthase
MVVCQKYLTGHPKGPAAAWMLNGLLQALNDGIVPGNRNLGESHSLVL